VTGALACAGGGLAIADPAGHTTFDETIRPAAGTGFLGVQTGPGEKYLTRQGVLGRAGRKRAGKRRSLIFFAQFSDVHIRDTQSPARVDFVDPSGPPLDAAWRPAEALSTQVFDQVVRNVNANKTSTVRGAGGKRARLSFAITTGDNTDNQQFNEVQWFSKLLAGGPVDPFSGKPIGPGNPCSASAETVARLNADVAARHYTGVQDYDDYADAPNDRKDGFWDPDQAPPDLTSPYASFPRYPGLMDRAQLPFTAQGLQIPYFVARGNHDGEIQGNIAATFALARGLIAGCNKIEPGSGFDPQSVAGLTEEQLIDKFADPQFQQQLLSGLRPAPPDPDRKFVSAQAFRGAFAGAKKQGGYGYVSAAEKTASKGAASYYAYSPKKPFRFISLDTVAEGGGQDGNLDNAQYKWLKRELDRNSSIELRGKRVVRDKDPDRLIVLYGHHPLDTLDNKSTDESAGKCASEADEAGCDRDPRVSTPVHLGLTGKNNVRDLLLRYPNVIAYVNGHRHANRIKAYKDRRYKNGFWEINTASHTDWPQQARLIDVEDNRDGTLSLFNTMVDSAAPVKPPDAGSVSASFTEAQIGSLARVLAVNDPQSKFADREGRHADRNTELVVRDPRVLDRKLRRRR
jgi:metallophosphoesterase (TIGR03767 family)